MLSNALYARFAAAGEQRYSDRRILRLEARISSGASSDEAQVHNLSHTGMLVESDGEVKVGDTIEVELGDDQVYRATIVWADDKLFGCRFDVALSQGALSAALLRSPPPVVAEPGMTQREMVSTLLGAYPNSYPTEDDVRGKLPVGKRMWVIGGLAAAAWAVPAAAAYLIL